MMYWFISISIKTSDHKEIIKEFQTEKYNTKFEYKSFLISLKNLSFREKQSEILKQFFKGK